MKATATTVANPSAIHCFSPLVFVASNLLSVISKALFVFVATCSLRRSLSISLVAHPSAASPIPTLTTASPSPLCRFLFDKHCKGADILVEALEREGFIEGFAYPGGTSMEIHRVLTHPPSITNHLFCHEQREVFAASGYARSIGRPDICIATSSSGATNLVSSLADALLDFVPMVAITGHETPIVEVIRSITKHNYLVLDVDISCIVKEAFFLAFSGHPGPVIVGIPKDIQQQLFVPIWDQPLRLPGYLFSLPKSPTCPLLDQIVHLVSESRRPVLYVGDGCSSSDDELRCFVELTGIPITTTLMGLGNYPSIDELSPRMLRMHGTVLSPF